ncbi:DUF5677 domain-containing protein [Cellulosimicrobium cellulans]|uniref:DUF5677 domain-containing protein n=1 Tax=Cellulosimicrobium cellulans TaxID=1710 RepID=UPI003662EE76
MTGTDGGRDWGARILAAAPETARQIAHHVELALDGTTQRDFRTRAEIASDYPTQLRALDHVVFAMEQHGVLMLERIDAVREDHHTSSRSALTLVHSSATMTLQEIRCLAVAGYWVGAAARWRGLHELAVTARLIAEGGPEIAQRYLDHGFVVQTKRLSRYYEEHGAGPIDPAALKERSQRAVLLEQAHALANSQARFRDAYGWAIPLLPTNAAGEHVRPTFDRLEAQAGYDARRLLVTSAHGMVHNDSAGVLSAVVLDEGYSLGPQPMFTKTVLQPTLESITWLVAATHVRFEPSLDSRFARLLSLQGAGLMHLCSQTLLSFGDD